MVSIVAFQAVDPGSIPGPRIAFFRASSLLSLVVEHSLCKRKVGGSIPPVGCVFVSFVGIRGKKKRSTSQRFELWRAEPNRFLIYLLNHSDTMSCTNNVKKNTACGDRTRDQSIKSRTLYLTELRRLGEKSAPCGARTRDLWLIRPILYRLS